jgi:hypothetical protein
MFCKNVPSRTLTSMACILALSLILTFQPAFASDKKMTDEEKKEKEWQEQYKDFKKVDVEKYGYRMWVPKEFELSGKIDKTSSWMFQPGSATTSKKKSKKFGLRGSVKIGKLGLSGSKSQTETSEGSGGGLESAVSIYVNWAWMPDVDSKTMYNANLKQVKDDIDSPDPDYRKVQHFDKKKGYKYEGLTFWYQEVDKDAGDEIHRWHIKSYGNKSAYVIGLCGTYEQFKEWGPKYEKVIKSFELIPLEK